MHNSLGVSEYQTGSRGETVKEIQSYLTRRGYAPGPIDGIFGTQTRTAVMRFQSDRGMTIDGIVGPATWSALIASPVQVPPPASAPVAPLATVPTAVVMNETPVSPSTISLLMWAGLGILSVLVLRTMRTARR